MDNDMNNGQSDETADELLLTEVAPAPLDEWQAEVRAEAVADALAPLDVIGNARDIILAVHRATEQGARPLRAVQIATDDRPRLETLVDLAYLTRDDISDVLGITTNGRSFIGILPEGVLDLPVEVAEITGNIEEAELTARYVEGKIAAIDKAIALREAPQHMMTCSWEESYQHCAITLKALVDEIRMGLHHPPKIIEGRVTYYNEDRSTGVSHANAVTIMVNDIHQRNVMAGWWHDLHTGEPLIRNPGELIALCHSELSEALEGVRKTRMDDHLPHRPQEEVEMADCVIRIADYCGGRKLDLGGAIDEKLAYNAQRADHKPENRLLDDGKKM